MPCAEKLGPLIFEPAAGVGGGYAWRELFSIIIMDLSSFSSSQQKKDSNNPRY